jgi:hypothetical protein
VGVGGTGVGVSVAVIVAVGLGVGVSVAVGEGVGVGVAVATTGMTVKGSEALRWLTASVAWIIWCPGFQPGSIWIVMLNVPSLPVEIVLFRARAWNAESAKPVLVVCCGARAVAWVGDTSCAKKRAMPLSSVNVTLTLGRKLCPRSVRCPPDVTLELPLSARPGEKTVAPRPTDVPMITARAAIKAALTATQPGKC